MSLLQEITRPANGQDVFSPIVFEYAWAANSCLFIDQTGIAAIEVSISYEPFIAVGDAIRILNGSYQGTYTVTAKTPDVSLILTLNTAYIGSSAATGSNEFTPEGAQDFQLIAGYASGPESTEKPWQVIDEIRVSPGPTGVYRFDVSGFLRSRFAITPPTEGANVPISLRFDARLKSAAALPSDANAITAYYGLESLSSAQQAGTEPVGERPILFFGNAPTLYSLALGKGIIHNFVSNPAEPAATESGAEIDLRLLSCQPKEINWLGASPTAGFTVSPTLPSWIQATAVGNNIELILNPCTAGVGDYLAADYNPIDYLTAGEVNSVTGCYSFAFSLSGSPLFTLAVCVDPISEILTVCPADVLNFAWLNQRGGFSSFAIECKYDSGREFGSDNTVVDAAHTLKRVEFRDVYDFTEARGGVLSKNQLDLLASMRSAIQVFLYNEGTAAFDIPIVLDRSSFRTYGNRFNQSETRFSFRFRKAKQVNVQTQ
jgi:hypothetical protein